MADSIFGGEIDFNVIFSAILNSEDAKKKLDELASKVEETRQEMNNSNKGAKKDQSPKLDINSARKLLGIVRKMVKETQNNKNGQLRLLDVAPILKQLREVEGLGKEIEREFGGIRASLVENGKNKRYLGLDNVIRVYDELMEQS